MSGRRAILFGGLAVGAACLAVVLVLCRESEKATGGTEVTTSDWPRKEDEGAEPDVRETAPPCVLEFRQLRDGKLAESGTPVDPEAVLVATHKGRADSVNVTDTHVAVDYCFSGVLFDRASGKPVRRYTVAGGWPDRRPEGFRPRPKQGSERYLSGLVGPGVAYGVIYRHRKPIAVANVTFAGRTWRAVHHPGSLEKHPKSWGNVLRILNENSRLETEEPGGTVRRFTTADGLAGNIVSKLVVAGGTLWALCVDIYDSEKKEWGPGGLCRFDPRAARWEHIRNINGRPARWITLLQAAGDELWVGFREGTGLAEERLGYGMGSYFGEYRPKVTALVLACLKNGNWTSFTRAPVKDTPLDRREHPRPYPPSERFVSLGISDGMAVVLSRHFGPKSGIQGTAGDEVLSTLDLASGKWRLLDIEKEFGTKQIYELVSSRGEMLVSTYCGVYQWRPEGRSWRFLDPGAPLVNSSIGALGAAGDELWVGYRGYGRARRRGISRYDETTHQWTHMSHPDAEGAPAFTEADRYFVSESGERKLVAANVGKDDALTGVAEIAGSAPGDVWVLYDVDHTWPGLNHRMRYSTTMPPIKWAAVHYLEEKPHFEASLDALPEGIRQRMTKPTWRHMLLAREKPKPQRNKELRRWARVPTRRDGEWTVGPFISVKGEHVAETPQAVWIAKGGSLVRLDRGKLAEWIGK